MAVKAHQRTKDGKRWNSGRMGTRTEGPGPLPEEPQEEKPAALSCAVPTAHGGLLLGRAAAGPTKDRAGAEAAPPEPMGLH